MGVPTGTALLTAAGTAAAADTGGSGTGPDPDAPGRIADHPGQPATFVLLQPAGSNDRVISRVAEPSRILPGGTDPDLREGERLVAVDLAGRAPGAAVALGEAAVAGLAASMLAVAASRLAAGRPDDLATLVPEYVTLPRGVRSALPDEGVEVTGASTRPSAGPGGTRP